MKLALAPMVNLTHAAFRELVACFGGCDLFFTEMVNVRMLKATSPEKDPYLIPAKGDRPLIVQLVGRNPADFEYALEKLDKLDYISGYNLNLGCIKGRFQKYGWGASLLKEPSLVEEILAVLKASTRSLSVKMRIPHGCDEDRLFKFMDIFEKYKLDFVVVHARTPEDGFKRPARWQFLKKIKGNTTLNIWGNGDVFSPYDALKMVDETGVDGVVIGRAALIRPWIFRDTKTYVDEEKIPDNPDLVETIRLFSEYIKRYLPQKWWSKRFDSFLYWFLQNFDNALFYFKKIRGGDSVNEKVNKLISLLSCEKPRNYPIKPFLLL